MTIPQASLCSDLGFLNNAMASLLFIGIQGLILVRTLALCQGYRPMTIAISTVFFITLILDIYVIRQVWGLRKEKRRLRLRINKDFATLLLHQGILRFSFVLVVPVAQLIIGYVSPTVGSDLTAFQNVLSTILICEFTLALRRLNTTRSLHNQSALELPAINLSYQDTPVRSIQSIIGRIQQSIIADMSLREQSDQMGVDSPGEERNPETSLIVL
ncbi:hypothetical protein Clacol_004343 [Clathrus columnatus]|uniref:Uncharacterized protein n=1 Tax=Clathrus columnatus TaxID=1419009 RepID=A0AAV5A8V8_9AGAM|nr:hypothetical protein Clacol_004343 [Clathrus columnatus]